MWTEQKLTKKKIIDLNWKYNFEGDFFDYVSNGIIPKWHKNEKFPKWHKFHATGALEKSRTIFSWTMWEN